MVHQPSNELVRAYGTAEVTGQNGTLEAAIETAVAAAAKNHPELLWFQVVEVRGKIANQRPDAYQVTLKVGYGVPTQ